VITYDGVFSSPSPFALPLPIFFGFGSNRRSIVRGCSTRNFLGVRVLVQDQKAVTNRAGIDNDNGNGLGLGVKAHCSPGFWLRQIGKQGTGTREQGSGFRSQGFQRLY